MDISDSSPSMNTQTSPVSPTLCQLSYWLIPFVVIGSGLWTTSYRLIEYSKSFASMKRISSFDPSFLISFIFDSLVRSSLFYGLITLVVVFCFNRGWRRSWQIALAIVGTSLLSGFVMVPFFKIPEAVLTMRSMIFEGNAPPYNEWVTRFGYCVIPAFLEGIGIAIVAFFFMNRHRLNCVAILLTPLCCTLVFLPFIFSTLSQDLLPFGFQFSGSGSFAFALFFYMGRSRWPFFTPKESAPFRTRGILFLGAFLLVFTVAAIVLVWPTKSMGNVVEESASLNASNVQSSALTVHHFHFAANDPNTSRTPPVYKPGEKVYLVFEIKGYMPKDSKVWLQEDLMVQYPDGSVGLKQENVVDYHQTIKPSGGAIELTNNIELPSTARTGTYVVTITLRDMLADKFTVIEKQSFTVKK